MPRPRFEKLPSEKREHILETAAKEFAAHGYEGASLNQILAKAGISKGAAYYYFDNKADLYVTTVTRYAIELIDSLDINLEGVTAVSFWPTLQNLYEQQFTQFAERPWVFGVVKSNGPIDMEALANTQLGDYAQDVEGMLESILRQGMALGVVRTDLPDDLLFSLVVTLDDAHDKWLLTQMSKMGQKELKAAAVQMVGLLQQLLTPTHNK
ncbi:MAG: TetR family transcriptional regulator [Aquificales bacterium]|nr:TetR family transcriptional regulator [Aquificales bacterium]